ncbi:MAG: DUF2283 domain-containing protein [Dehalococcoidia bacterium]|nr:DUF2283 domain-containing protein [Dehalococcoidia bacterium]
MGEKQVKVWYDPEGDFLEVIFEQREGYFRETEDDRVMEKVDSEGNVLGFSILGVGSLKGVPIQVALS